ncbi:MAG: RNA polymerase sigma factor [Chloroflexi bacterium]|nr:RNA polymerase sigma factor [Chloroflexota bacterium]
MTSDLVRAAQRGDRAAFEALVRDRVGDVYRTSLAILGRPADAEDATQEALLSAWRSIRGLRDIERFDAWLGRIVVNACRMTLRKRARIREIPAADVVRGLEPDAEPATDHASNVVDAAAFDRAFERLTVDERAILVLRHHDELSISDLAGRLGIPAGTVKSRLSRARAALERALELEHR